MLGIEYKKLINFKL